MKNLINNQKSESVIIPLIVLFIVTALSLAGISLLLSPQNEVSVLYFLLFILLVMGSISIHVFFKK